MDLKIINKGSYFFSLYNAINSFININNFNYVLYYSEVFNIQIVTLLFYTKL